MDLVTAAQIPPFHSRVSTPPHRRSYTLAHTRTRRPTSRSSRLAGSKRWTHLALPVPTPLILILKMTPHFLSHSLQVHQLQRFHIHTDTCRLSEPTAPLTTKTVSEFSLSSKLYPESSARPFAPDSDFYNAVCCEGLWVCTSKNVEEEVLHQACALVRAIMPRSLRECFGKFRSPLWAKDPGPMRLVILDNRSDEQVGMVPELQDNSKGRNGERHTCT